MIFQRISSGSLPLKPTISVLGTPSVTVWKISPSLPPCFHSQSNKFGHRPLRFEPSVAWQYPAQVASKRAFPVAIASALPAKGVFKELSTGVSALAEDSTRAIKQRVTLKVKRIRPRCIVFSLQLPTGFLSPELLHLRQAIGSVKRLVKRNAITLQQRLERAGCAELGQSLVDRLSQSRVALARSHMFVPTDDSRRFITCNEEQFQLRVVA